MSTGALLTHGVSGFPCTGVASEFQEQRRGEPFENIMNDPILSYLNAQSHIGYPMSNFNEPWTGGALQAANWSAQPYRTPVFGEPVESPPFVEKDVIPIAEIDHPSHIGQTYTQQLPTSRIHKPNRLPVMDRQNVGWEGVGFNQYAEGDNKVMFQHTAIPTMPNTVNFQGASTAAGVHPGADTANQSTTANTIRTDFKGGQTPWQKLPNGLAVAANQPGEPPALWEQAPPPDPPVLPGEGTLPLQPTNPAWW